MPSDTPICYILPWSSNNYIENKENLDVTHSQRAKCFEVSTDELTSKELQLTFCEDEKNNEQFNLDFMQSKHDISLIDSHITPTADTASDLSIQNTERISNLEIDSVINKKKTLNKTNSSKHNSIKKNLQLSEKLLISSQKNMIDTKLHQSENQKNSKDPMFQYTEHLHRDMEFKTDKITNVFSDNDPMQEIKMQLLDKKKDCQYLLMYLSFFIYREHPYSPSCILQPSIENNHRDTCYKHMSVLNLYPISKFCLLSKMNLLIPHIFIISISLFYFGFCPNIFIDLCGLSTLLPT